MYDPKNILTVIINISFYLFIPIYKFQKRKYVSRTRIDRNGNVHDRVSDTLTDSYSLWFERSDVLPNIIEIQYTPAE